jgi:hypothetical protein
MTSIRTQTRSDAKTGGLRALAIGLLIDVSVAIILVLAARIGDLEWTAEYWAAIGLSVSRSAVQAAVTYLARTLVPPPPAS